MSGEIDTYGLGNTRSKAALVRRAAVHIADRIGSEHPHDLDDLMPRLAGRQTARKPEVRDGVLELLDIVPGLPTTTRQLRAVKARARIEQTRHHQGETT
jgi:hypothetical protein